MVMRMVRMREKMMMMKLVAIGEEDRVAEANMIA